MEPVKKRLSAEYRAGARWLAADVSKRAGWLARLRCFEEYSAAAAWCRARTAKDGVFRIRVLAEVLAGMNGLRVSVFTGAEGRVLRELIGRRPISTYIASIPLEMGLARQRWFPVVWSSVLEPLSVVRAYQIVSRGFTGTGKLTVRVLGAYPDFRSAMRVFSRAIRGQRPSEEVLLAGAICEHVDFSARELAVEDGVLVFYRSPVGLFDRSGVDAIEQVNDPTTELVIRTAYFAGYDRVRGRLNFYDGRLRRVEPGMEAERIDLAYFDFDGSELFEELKSEV